MRTKFLAVCAAAMLMTPAIALSPASAGVRTPSTTVNWRGQGLTNSSDLGYYITNTVCAPSPGAELEDNYLLFVLASTKKLSNPRITISYNGSNLVSGSAMYRTSNRSARASSYKFAYQMPSGVFDFAKLAVRADYTGNATPVLTIGHGCYVAPPVSIVFNGEFDDTTGSSGYYNLNQAVSNGTWLKVCQAGSTTICVLFDGTTAKGTAKDLHITGSSVALDVSSGDDGGTVYDTQSARFANGSNATTSPAEGWFKDAWTTTARFGGGDTAYFVVWNQAGPDSP